MRCCDILSARCSCHVYPTPPQNTIVGQRRAGDAVVGCLCFQGYVNRDLCQPGLKGMACSSAQVAIHRKAIVAAVPTPSGAGSCHVWWHDRDVVSLFLVTVHMLLLLTFRFLSWVRSFLSTPHFGPSRKVGSVRTDSANVGNPVLRIRMNRVASTGRFFQRFSARFLACIAFVCHSGGTLVRIGFCHALHRPMPFSAPLNAIPGVYRILVPFWGAWSVRTVSANVRNSARGI